MKLKMIESGMEHYEGNFGGFEFADGVSCEDIPKNDIVRIGAIIAVVDADDESKQQSQGQFELTNWNKSADVVTYQTLADDDADRGGVEIAAEPPKRSKPVTVYSREALQTIADEKGIKGLREIAINYGVKGTSIVDLIEEILTVQNGAATAKITDSEVDSDLSEDVVG